MIPIAKIDSVLLFIGVAIFSGAFDAMLTTFDPNVGGAEAGGNATMQITSGAIYVLTFALILARVERFLVFSSRNLLILIFLLIPVFSIFWSIAPETTLRRAVALLGTSVFALYIAFAAAPERVLRIFATVYGLIAVLSLAFIAFLPAYGTHQIGEYAGVWRGVYAQKNEFGASMAIGLLCLVLCPKENKQEILLSRLAIFLCAFLLLMSQSRAAWLSLGGAILVTAPLHAMSGRGVRTGLKSSAYLVVLATLGAMVLYNSEALLVALGKDPTLTGRTGVWELTIDRAMMRPILGYGYRAYWITENKLRLQPTENWSDGIGHAHNTYVDMFAEIGLFGVIAFFLILMVMIHKMSLNFLKRKDVVNAWMLLCLVFVMIRGFAEATMLQHADINWVLFVYIFAVLNQQSRAHPHQSSGLTLGRMLETLPDSGVNAPIRPGRTAIFEGVRQRPKRQETMAPSFDGVAARPRSGMKPR